MKMTDSPGAMEVMPLRATAAPNELELSSIFQPAMLTAVGPVLVTSNQSAPTGLLLLAQGATSEMTSEGLAGSSLTRSVTVRAKDAVASGVLPTMRSSRTTVTL